MNAVPLHAAPSRPVPVVAATLLAAAYAVHSAYLGVNGILHHDALAIVPVLELGVWGLLLVGLWRGHHLAYVLVTVAATLTILAAAPAIGDAPDWHLALSPALRLVIGMALLGVLLIPEDIRSYYARRR
ncbi:hypothetical protein [Cryptosporangium sp. NPDC048952]|uniref:hypothetical protein n=1 Tax=Cryptosporangium sp. NPDC048952 TaxID=3363961 RepID=UPI0037164E4F